MDYHKFIYFKKVMKIQRRHSMSVIYDVRSFLKAEVVPRHVSWEWEDVRTAFRIPYLSRRNPFPLSSAYTASTETIQ